MVAVEAGAVKLKGIVEADETRLLTSRKGARKLDRKRGGVASKRGLSPFRGLAKAQAPHAVLASVAGPAPVGPPLCPGDAS